MVPLEINLSMCPPPPQPFVDAVTYEKISYFISTLLIYILEYIYVTCIYNIALFQSILFRRNTLSTYTINKILSIFGITFGRVTWV